MAQQVDDLDGGGLRADPSRARVSSSSTTSAGSRFSVVGSESTRTGRRPDIADRVGRRHERQRRDEDLVARTDVQDVQGQVDGRGARCAGDRVAGADVLGEGGLEAPDVRPDG